METTNSKLKNLTAELNSWCAQNNLPAMSADDLLHDINAGKLVATDEQKDWLVNFCERWDNQTYIVPKITLLVDGHQTTFAEWLEVNTLMESVDHVSRAEADRVKNLKVGESTYVNIVEIKRIG